MKQYTIQLIKTQSKSNSSEKNDLIQNLYRSFILIEFWKIVKYSHTDLIYTDLYKIYIKIYSDNKQSTVYFTEWTYIIAITLLLFFITLNQLSQLSNKKKIKMFLSTQTLKAFLPPSRNSLKFKWNSHSNLEEMFPWMRHDSYLVSL